MTMRTLGMVSLAYLIASAATVAAYGYDKLMAARAGGTPLRRRPRRVPEQTLHLLELLGGWPGALLAQQLFRHKRSKRRYMVWFWVIVALHAAGWAAWLIWA